jgi:arsenate reductase
VNQGVDPLSDKITVYQKPTCSKCRMTLDLLKQRGIEFEAIDYYQRPLSVEELRGLLDKLGLAPRDVLRRDEPVARQLGIDAQNPNDDELLRLMVENPDLIQRPIVVRGERAVVARPPQDVEKLL